MREATDLHASLCQAIADPTRISILYALNEKPCRVNELVTQLQSPQATISRHLKILREQAIVETHREGSFVTYSLGYQRIIQALDIMRSIKLDIVRKEHDLIHE
ncbi:MAG: winged helix-turn-helix transcriptional regulator [Candidatus Marinimicrobia bacterium]|jgi:DNA-binding transcriptional ArsR family regulator|nr:winged helix-turn-helix transcriptional regulator [Candidatus Neomarinimicrobiota bacterium]MBT3631945.1 winged helix-turn-helix transcriptional regulator [Candidatus Neomarinimicrobiota bacterium]MBT3824026.1 winged helix-turn-helix transcriptional regulator [Candidatus Neomarinimicrobiota bacterium]MBT4131286.1 winged helix-turn-helix transcriptional regulator [Candidatus Neomarinimicrobiota bacterium]MBT4295370.1 winged helix-turn-helix transcriptional regulator [Candidatus Neomarinimicro